ncbi:hypothetical protein [Actinoplanes sp. NPDC049118]|uniref:hypothetical protein n=1 Tax=Actinoplanes sp. NPDC049118 TaxID=3155769 RepID=UPI00340554A7
MTSMRKLNRRLLRWDRYAHRTYWNPRVTRPRWMGRASIAFGHRRAWDAREKEQERRFWDETPEVWLGGPAGEAALIAGVCAPCFDCGLPDTYDGQGDGIGSCECPRCERCGSGPGCDCRWDDDNFACPCGGGCWDDRPDDDGPPMETVTAFQDAGLL